MVNENKIRILYKLYRRRDSYGKICKAKNTASCAKSV